MIRKEKPKSPVPKGKRLSLQQITDLKELIYREHVINCASLRDISRLTGYAINTVISYANIVDAEVRDEMKDSFDRDKFLNRVLKRKEARLREFSKLVDGAKPGREKASFLRDANDVENDVVRIIQDVGVVPRLIGHLDTSSVVSSTLSVEEKDEVIRKMKERTGVYSEKK